MMQPENLTAISNGTPRSMPAIPQRLALVRAKASQRRIVRLPFMLVAATAAAISAGAPIPARAQGAGSSNRAEISLYFGLSRGDLKNPNNEQELRAFAVMQEQIKAINERLAKRISNLLTADLSFWNYTDWEKLRPLPITHYIVAHPSKITFQPDKTKPSQPAIQVEWHLGKFAANQFSPDRKPVYAALLKEKTVISIPASEDKPLVWQRLWNENSEEFMPFGGSSGGSAEIADRIVAKLRMAFPEMRDAHKYFVDCFDRKYESVMVHLSQHLREAPQGGALSLDLSPAWTLRRDEDVKDMCRNDDYRKQGNKVRRDEANFWLQGKIANWNDRIQTLITIEDRLRDDRNDTATVTDPNLGDEPAGNAPLSDFCLPKGSKRFGITDLETLTAYIQARGFRAMPSINLGGWKCDARPR
jgi:hypothetical protein